MSSPAPDRVRRIAVLRANGIGDLVFALPALEALRARFRGAEVVLLGRPWHAELLRGRPSPVDRVETLPVAALDDPSGRNDDDVRAFIDRMRRHRFDLAIQLHGGGRTSNRLVRTFDAAMTVGMRTPDADPLDRWIPYVYHQAEIARYLEVVALVGARPVTLDPTLSVVTRDLHEANDAVPPDGQPLVVLHAGATDPRRRWPARSFAAVGDAIHARGARVVLTGTSDELALARDVAASMDRRPVLALDTSLSTLVGLLARAGLVLANDTGPLHLAGALGTPTIGIYWCGNLINGGPLSVGHRRHATSWRIACPVCGIDCTRGRCDHDASFVADVDTDDVLSTADDLLGVHPLRADHGVDPALTMPVSDSTEAPSEHPRRGAEASSEPPGGIRRMA